MIDGTQVVIMVSYILQGIGILLVVRALMSWFPDLHRFQIVQLLFEITDPILQPLRKIIPPVGFLDLSVMIAVFFLFAVAAALRNAAGS